MMDSGTLEQQKATLLIKDRSSQHQHLQQADNNDLQRDIALAEEAREASLKQQCLQLYRKKTLPMLTILFFLEVLYAGWSTMKYRCLDLKQVENAPIFMMGCILQVYLGVMAIKDGLILISLSKMIKCISQVNLLCVHSFIQVLDILALLSISITVCMQNFSEPEDSNGVQAAEDFYSICKMSVIVALTLAVVKFFALLYLMFYRIFGKRLITEEQTGLSQQAIRSETMMMTPF